MAPFSVGKMLKRHRKEPTKAGESAPFLVDVRDFLHRITIFANSVRRISVVSTSLKVRIIPGPNDVEDLEKINGLVGKNIGNTHMS
jgi:hypothetical protein